MKLSVIIPIYNAEKTLHRCLESIVNQTYSDLEILLIDDGSTDGSLNICNEYASKDSRIVVIDRGNKGVSATRNEGLAIARGEFVAFVDSDDYLDSTMYTKLMDNAINKGNDMVFCRYYEVINGNISEKKEDALQEALTDKNYYYFIMPSKSTLMGVVWRSIIRREIAQLNLFVEDIKIAEDLLFILHAIDKSRSIGLVDECLYYYFVDSVGPIKYLTAKHIDSYCLLGKELNMFMNEHNMQDLAKSDLFDKVLTAWRCWLYPKKNEKSIKKTLLANLVLKEFNTKVNYQAYLESHSSKSRKLFAFCIRHHIYNPLRVMIQVNLKIKRIKM